MKSCCTPSRADAPGTPHQPAAVATPTRHADLLALAGGEFTMGTDAAEEGFAEDGEGPARRVRVQPFTIAATAVTNAQFSEFVRATRYITEAEQAGSAFVFYLQVPEERRRLLRQVSRELPWWLSVEGACWQRPTGPGSSAAGLPDHPVVQVSWHDAAAYCAWSGTRLPTEAEWEYAARGGLPQARYPWGDTLQPDGQPRCNIWQGEFPARPASGWAPGAVPVQAFAPNGFGLYNTAGNVWEWCADWFSPAYHRETAAEDPLQSRATGRRAQRGGSFLCHDSYCNRYRVAARGANSPGTSTSNCGFRVAAPLD